MSAQTRREFLARVTPRDELVNVLEFEAEAARALSPALRGAVSGSNRAAFDRMTFRPRMMVNCVDLDLSVDLFGRSLFAPILVGPIADQRRFHPDGETATVRGATAAKAAVTVSSRSSVPLTALAQGATTPLLAQVYASDNTTTLRDHAREAERAGCVALVVSLGDDTRVGRPPSSREWAALETLRGASSLPVIVKGVMTAADATTAISRGARGLVVSTHGQGEAPGRPAPLDAIAPIVAAVGPDVPVLVDGGFRRGTDVMKALALGARAVLVARPVMWGLAAYGADGVQTVLELLQTELGRVMGCCGAPNLGAIARQMVKTHAPAPPASSP